MSTGYDFIGDVHGKASRLRALLSRLGYREIRGAWRHPYRTAVFVGDLIDRGPEQLATVELVRRMHEEGSALCVMGNHEHNAIGWVTPHPDRPGEFCRAHTEAQRRQHADFLAEVASDPKRHADVLAWFARLPVLLELGNIRVAHACWDERHVPLIRAACKPDGTFTEEGLLASLTKGTELFEACEVVMKGPEARIPEGRSYIDPMGKERFHVRIAWWKPERTIRAIALPMPGLAAEELPDVEVPLPLLPRVSPHHLHIFGHYWMTGTPQPLAPKLVCVDYHGSPEAPLTAYRWEGEDAFQPGHFVQVA